ncbi:MAG: glutamine synthetase, partial [Rhodobacteraceae bacterium]|nr:glutamine synthetase [Paracoccaceae bacterium]
MIRPSSWAARRIATTLLNLGVNRYKRGDLPKIPLTLEDSLALLQADEPLLELLTHEGVQTFIVDKQYEIAKAKASVADYGTPEWYSRVDSWERA